MSQTQLGSSGGTPLKGNRRLNLGGVEWDAETKAFCRITSSIMEDGYEDNEPPPWALIGLILKDETRETWTVNEMRSKWKHLRQLFTVWKPIIGNGTGIGWNTETGTITADNDWWHERIKENPDAAALKDKRMPPWSELQKMFGSANDNLKQGLSSSPCNLQHVSTERADHSSTLNRSHDHGPAAQENPTPNFQSKGKGPSDLERVQWVAVTKAFCRITASIIEDGYVGNKGAPTSLGFEKIIPIIQEEKGHPWTVKELRSKWRHLKKLFNLWKPILGNATGIGWNPETGTLAADDDWWHERIEANPDAAAFKYKAMPPWSDLQTLFDPDKDNLKGCLSSSQCNMQHVSSTLPNRSSARKRYHDHRLAVQENPTPNLESSLSKRAAKRLARQAATIERFQPFWAPSVRTSPEHLQPGQFTEGPKSPLGGHSTWGTQNVAAPFDPSLVPPVMESCALNDGHQSSDGEHADSSQNADMRQDIAEAPKRRQDFSEHFATFRAHKSDTSIGTCMEIVRSLQGVTQRDPFYIDTLMLISRDVEMREALVFGVHEPEARMAYLRREVERARKNGSL